MKNKFLVKSLSVSLIAAMLFSGTMPMAVRASDWSSDSGTDMIEDSQEQIWDDPIVQPDDPDPQDDPDNSEIDTDPEPTLAPEPTVDPDGGDGGDIFEDPIDDSTPGGEVIEDVTPTPLPIDGGETEDPFSEGNITPSPEEAIEPTQGAQEFNDFTSDDNLTPTPSGALTATPIPSVTPLVTGPVKITTNMVSNLHAGNQFYLDSLKNNYGLIFSNDFARIMDDIEYEYLLANQLIRADGTRGVTTDALGNPLVSSNLAPAVGQNSGVVTLDLGAPTSTGVAGSSVVVLDFVGDVAVETSDVSLPSVSSPNPAVAGTADDFTSGPDTVFADELNPPSGLLARNWQDVLAIYCYQMSKTGATQFNLDKNAKKNLAEIFKELNPIRIENGQAYYGNRHVNDYVVDHNIPKWDRAVLKKYTETDCKLLCATVTAAKGFVRQSVGENVSEERVNVIAAAYSLVGKVGYFWGGKSTVIGMDPSWGIVQTVTSAGSGTTGTLRGYGLDCSGFVTWAVINGYRSVGMKSLVGDGTSDQWLKAKVVTEAGAQPGDLVFQSGPEAGADNHVGILVGKTDAGDWIAVHCSSSQNGVTVGEAYSASFRYIREPSFFPIKNMTPAAPSQSLDDVLVDADLGVNTTTVGSNLFASDDSFFTMNEDFMDIILLDGAQSQANPQSTSVSPFAATIDTGGVVVLDESGRGDDFTSYVSSLFGDGSSNSFASDIVVLDSLGTQTSSNVNTYVNASANVVVLDYVGEQAPVCGPYVTTAPTSIFFEDGSDLQTLGEGIVVIENLNASAPTDLNESYEQVYEPEASQVHLLENSSMPQMIIGGEEEMQEMPETESFLPNEAEQSTLSDVFDQVGSDPIFTSDEVPTEVAIYTENTPVQTTPAVSNQVAAQVQVAANPAPAQSSQNRILVSNPSSTVSSQAASVVEILPNPPVSQTSLSGSANTVVVLDFTGFERPLSTGLLGKTLTESTTKTNSLKSLLESTQEKSSKNSLKSLLESTQEKSSKNSSSLFDQVWEKLSKEGKVTGSNPRTISLKLSVGQSNSFFESMVENKTVLKQAQENSQPIVIIYDE